MMNQLFYKTLLREYPYFQTVHLLLAKALSNTDSILFAKQLKIALNICER